LWTVALAIAHDSAWYLFNVPLFIIYHYNLFPQYKLYPAEKFPDRSLVVRCLVGCIIKNTVINPLAFYFVICPLFILSGSETFSPVPPLFTFVWQIAVCFILTDFLFYWTHRLLHYPFFYKLVHKKHHRFTLTIGIASEFADPVDDLISSTIPTIAPPILLKCHMSVACVFLFLRMWETIDAHSGYCFPWSVWTFFPWLNGGPRFHEFHHRVNVGNFGMLRFWDWAMGTDGKYTTIHNKE